MRFILSLFGGSYANMIMAGAVLAIVIGGYAKGVMDANQRRAVKDLQEHSDTLERINEAISEPILDDQLDDRLRSLAE